jgi:peptidoglycan hydrolase CwlO-like protein
MEGDGLLNYLMTSDFHEDWSTKDLKDLLIFFRNEYRKTHSQKKSFIYQIEELDKKIKQYEKQIKEQEIKLEGITRKYTKLNERKLTFRERILGKIIK